jgi:hypothetical protein
VAQHEAEVSPAPGYGLTLSDQSCRHAGDSSFSGRGGAVHVQVDAQRKKEASLCRGGDPRLKLNSLHY